MRWAEHIVCMGERRGAYRVLVGRHEGKRALGRPIRRWGQIVLKWIFIKCDGGNGLDWTDLAQDRDSDRLS